MSHDVLRIYGAGRFSNAGEEVVYLRVESSHLREVWWKPDYPITSVGFNPHISLYRGANIALADAVADLLGETAIDILCAEFQLVGSRPAQVDAFRDAIWREEHVSRYIKTGKIPVALLTELRMAVRAHSDG
jgi:hypothetical protein